MDGWPVYYKTNTQRHTHSHSNLQKMYCLQFMQDHVFGLWENMQAPHRMASWCSIDSNTLTTNTQYSTDILYISNWDDSEFKQIAFSQYYRPPWSGLGLHSRPTTKQASYTLKNKGASQCHRRTFLPKWFHKEHLTSEEPFCFTKGSLRWKKVLQIIKR